MLEYVIEISMGKQIGSVRIRNMGTVAGNLCFVERGMKILTIEGLALEGELHRPGTQQRYTHMPPGRISFNIFDIKIKKSDNMSSALR